MSEKWIYLDNNATTMVAPEVREAILPYLTDLYGNPSSIHTFGGQIHKTLEHAREQVAALLHCTAEEIIFTSCATEANNTVFHLATDLFPEKKHIITTAVEHPAVLSTCVDHYQDEGYRVTVLEVNASGQINLEELEEAICEDTLIVSMMWANNETGVIFPIKEAVEIAHKHGVLFHTDAVQAVGKIDIDMDEIPVDYLSLSGHKLHAPKGIGALFVRKSAPYKPFLFGGHQEKGKRGGTENVAGIIALGEACELASKALSNDGTQERKLRDYLESEILKAIPKTSVHGVNSLRLPNTANIGFKYIEGESILLMLNAHHIAASAGSACTSETLEPSHVLSAMKIPYEELHGSIRFSLSRYTTKEEIDKVLQIMPEIVQYLRNLSPLWPGNE